MTIGKSRYHKLAFTKFPAEPKYEKVTFTNFPNTPKYHKSAFTNFPRKLKYHALVSKRLPPFQSGSLCTPLTSPILLLLLGFYIYFLF